MSVDFEKIQEQVSLLRRKLPETIGVPRINGFDLSILPPWCDYEEDEILRVALKSAAVCCICPSGILMVHVIDSDQPYWDMPAGGRQEIDESPVSTAIRELYEETGLSVSEGDLELFGYAFRKKEEGNTGGLQYLCFVDIPIPEGAEVDDSGRIYFPPFEGTLADEVDRLVVEPLNIFVSKDTLLDSPHTWAYRRIQGSLLSRFERMKEDQAQWISVP